MKILQHRNFKTLILLSMLFGFNIAGFAINAPGYIITNNQDTIYGIVQLSRFDQVTGGLILNGIEEESFHSRIVFSVKDETRFKTYFPEMILGFGFTYKSINYMYQRITVQRKSIFKNEKQQYRFMRLIYSENGNFRYKDVRMISNPGLVSNKDKYLKYNSNLFRIKTDTVKKSVEIDSLKRL